VVIMISPEDPAEAAFEEPKTNDPVELLLLPPVRTDTEPPTEEDAAAVPPTMATDPPVKVAARD